MKCWCFLLACAVVACGGSTTRDAGDAGSGATGGGGAPGGGGSGGTGGGSPCTKACNAAASAKCPGQSQCVASCQQAYTQYPSCKAQFDAMLLCGMTHGTWQCDPSTGLPGLSLPSGVCSSESSALGSCLSSATGGYGGTAGSGGSPGCAYPNCMGCTTTCETCLCVYMGDSTQCTAYC